MGRDVLIADQPKDAMIQREMKKIFFAGIAILAVFALFLPAPAQALYPFGGRILAVLPPSGPIPNPLLCPLSSIVVGPPRVGQFMIPPARSYLHHQWARPGAWVLGLATGVKCGVILMIGTSLF